MNLLTSLERFRFTPRYVLFLFVLRFVNTIWNKYTATFINIIQYAFSINA